MYLTWIDYTQINNLEEHLEKGLKSEDPIYLSTPELYTYLDEPIPDQVIKDHCPYLARKLGLVKRTVRIVRRQT